MKEIITSKYAYLFLAGLLFHLVCAWFSMGFHHVDEHFQILEFASFKTGNSPASDLPWEFRYKMRAAILPSAVYLLMKASYAIGLYNPFTIDFILRLLTGMAAWFITCRLCLFLSKKIVTPAAVKLLILMSLFLWFIPYLNVRFSSENISGLIILYAVYMVLMSLEKNKESVFLYVLTGFLLGISFFVRIQVISAIIGFAAWLMLIQKIKWKYLLAMATGAVFAAGISIYIDYWFYGELIFTPYNNYFANIVKHFSADFGVFPWWFYFSEFIIKAIPPLSLILLFMFLTGVYKNFKNPMIWIIIPLVVAHCIIGHKELRFLFPATFIFIYITALGFDYFLTKPKYLKIHKYVFAGMLLINIPVLLGRTFISAEAAIPYYKFLYDYAADNTTILFSSKSDPDYHLAGLTVNFYKSPHIKSVRVENTDSLADYLNKNHLQSALYLNKKNLEFNDTIPGYSKTRIYTSFPSWALQFNINHWEERTQVRSIYELRRIK